MLYLVKSVFSFKVLVCTSLVTFEMLDKDGGRCPLSVSSPTTHVTGHHQGTVQVHMGQFLQGGKNGRLMSFFF